MKVWKLLFLSLAFLLLPSFIHAATPTFEIDWARIGFGGSQSISATDGCTDSSGNIYVIGTFDGTNINLGYPTGTAIYSLASGVNDDFIVKYDSNGVFQWARVLTAPQDVTGWDEAINACDTDSSGNVYIAGYFSGRSGAVDLDLTAGVDTFTSVGVGEGFFSKYDTNGNYQYTYITEGDDVNRPQRVIDIDVNANNIYVTGTYCSGNVDADMTPGGYAHVWTTAHCDAFVGKYTLAGAFAGVQMINNTSDMNPRDIIADDSDNVYVTMNWGGTVDFDREGAGDVRVAIASEDTSVTKYDSSLAYQWTRTVGGDSFESGVHLNVDPSGNVFFVGSTFSSTLTIEGRGSTYSSLGGYDAYIVKYNAAGTYQNAYFLGTNYSEEVRNILFTPTRAYIVGYASSDLVDFDFGVGTQYLPADSNATDSFMLITDLDLNFVAVNGINVDSVKNAFLDNNDRLIMLGDTYMLTNNYDPIGDYTLTHPVATSSHLWLAAYSEGIGYYILNTDPTLDFLDTNTNGSVDGQMYSSSATPEVEIIKPAADPDVTETTSSEVFSEVGTLLFQDDDGYMQYDLPFSFPFYSGLYDSINVGSNGNICLDISNTNCDWYADPLDDTSIGPFIQPLGIDLETDVNPGHGVFVDDTGDSVTIRWKANEYGESMEVNFSVTLYPSGEFVFKYGPQDIDFTYEAYVGVGIGDGVIYTAASNDYLLNYNNASSIGWLPATPPDKIAKTNVNMSADRDWVNVAADSDRTNQKAVVSNLATAPGADATFTFYVPFDNDVVQSRVVLCPGVTSLSGATMDCSNAVVKRESGADTDLVTIGINKYWEITQVGTNNIAAVSSTTNSLMLQATATVINAGGSVSLTATAKDQANVLDPSYRGTVTFNVSGGSAQMPGNYQFSAGDSGTHTFNSITFNNAGTYLITISDLYDPLLTSSVTVQVNALPTPTPTPRPAWTTTPSNIPSPTPEPIDCELDPTNPECPVQISDLVLEQEENDMRICFNTSQEVRATIRYGTQRPLTLSTPLENEYQGRHCFVLIDLDPDETYNYDIYVDSENDDPDAGPIIIHQGEFILEPVLPQTGSDSCILTRPINFKAVESSTYSFFYTASNGGTVSCNVNYGKTPNALNSLARLENNGASFTAYFDLNGYDLTQGFYYEINCQSSESKTCSFNGSLTSSDQANERSPQEIEQEAREATGRILTGVSIAVLTVSAAPLAFSIPRIYLYGLIWLFPRKKKKTWGLIYDESKRRPIAFAVARLYTSAGELVSQAVSDLNGRYGFVVDPGNYILKVEHSDYQTYEAGFNFLSEQKLAQDIGLTAKSAAQGFKFEWRRWLGLANLFIALFGFFLSLAALLISFNAINLAIIIFYILQILIIILTGRKKTWGVLKDINGNSVSGVFVRLLDPVEGRQLDVHMTDEKGRFEFIMDKGEYLVTADNKSYTLSDAAGAERMTLPSGEVAVKVNEANIGGLQLQLLPR
jgi:hypothetical protein